MHKTEFQTNGAEGKTFGKLLYFLSGMVYDGATSSVLEVQRVICGILFQPGIIRCETKIEKE